MKFTRFPQKELVRKSFYKLKDTDLSISEQFPRGIQDRRKKITTCYEESKTEIRIQNQIFDSKPQGSPNTPDACVQLIPRHPNPMFINNPSAFTISLSTSYYRFCDTPEKCGRSYIGISINGQGGLFRGFIIQARTVNGGKRSWGQFIPLQTGDSKVIQCQNGLTLTHTANNDKNIVRFAWIPEPGMREQVQFVATVVQNLRTIYPGVYSAQLRPIGAPTTTTTMSLTLSLSSTSAKLPITTVPRPTTPKPLLTTNTQAQTTSTVTTSITTTKFTTKITTTPFTTTTYSPVTSTAKPVTSSTKLTTTSSQPSQTERTEAPGSASFKTAGIISLVTSCLHKHIVTECEKKTSPTGFHCPVCRDFVPDPTKFENPDKWAECFPKNRAVEFFIDSGGKAALKRCKPCQNDNEEEEASEVCRTCMESLCKMCAKYHKRGTVTRDHDVFPVHEFKKFLQVDQQEMVCEKHDSRPLDLFCYDHKSPCCVVCSINEHSRCQNKDTIEKEAQVIEEKERNECLMSEIDNISRHLQKFKKLQEESRTKIEDKADEITEETKKKRRQIIEKLDSLENDHLEGLAKVMKSARKAMDENMEFISDLLDFSNHCKKTLQSVQTKRHCSSKVYSFHHVRKQVKRLKNTKISLKEIDLSLKFSDIFLNFDKIDQLASLSQHEKSKRLSINMIQNIRKTELQMVQKHEFERTVGYIFFTCMLEYGECLVFFYEKNACARLHASKRITWNIRNTCFPLYGIRLKDNIYIAGKEKFINVLDLYGSPTNKTITITERCYGLSVHQDSLFIICPDSVKQLDAEGVVKKTIPVQFPSNYLVFLFDGNIVYLKQNSNAIGILQPTAINQVGQELWVYKHPELRHPSGLAKDFAENLYIPCFESSIHVISNAGCFLKIFKNIDHPRTISFRKDRYEFSVVSGDNSVIVFRILEKNK
ncbi:uncharacterized protein LOC133188771 [Saccostrea echinata]|uniref:uncharacterized protein LOC133188771 n=1 Tax=Saccostrea echinata TaxID=191078 RepID=UPI002A83A2D4|nr:uncharacterized protein LOC133188771 [Saccostrea echinata]